MRVAPHPQFDFLVATCHSDPGPITLPDPAALPELIELATEHGVLLLLSVVVSLQEPNRAHGELIRAEARHQVAQNLALISDALAAITAITGAGFEVMLVKGAALSTLAFGTASARAFVDTDLLVRPGRLLEVLHVLEAAGFNVDSRLSPLQDPQRSVNASLTLVREGTGRLLELHWRLQTVTPRPILESSLWEASIPFELGTSEVRTISLENTMILLALEASKHSWIRLDWACCADRLARRPLDWDRLLRSSVVLGVRRRLLVLLGVSVELFDTPVPVHVRELMAADRPLGSIVGRVIGRLSVGHRGDDGLWQWWLKLAVADSAVERLRVILVPSAADTSVALPRRLSVLHYLTRPGRLAIRLARILAARRRERQGIN